MPPNRKSPVLLTGPYELENLKKTFEAKFLPLTDPREEAHEHDRQQKSFEQDLKLEPKTEKAAPTVSYWDWPSDIPDEERLEAIHDIFSISRLEANLVADSMQRKVNNKAVQTKSKDKDEESEEHYSYWVWSNEYGDDIKPHSRVEPTPQNEDRHCEQHPEDYWDWHHNDKIEETYCEASPSHRLHNIVDESRKKFIRRHVHLPEPEIHTDSIAVSDHYWHWSEFRSTNAT